MVKQKMSTLSVPVQLFTSVTVKLYVVVIIGLTSGFAMLSTESHIEGAQ